MAKPSPVKLKCINPWKTADPDMKVCRWTCPQGGAPVQFRARWRNDWYAILHKSTKQPGKWQVSLFDDHGAIGDVVRKTCEEALYDAGVGRKWKIDKI